MLKEERKKEREEEKVLREKKGKDNSVSLTVYAVVIKTMTVWKTKYLLQFTGVTFRFRFHKYNTNFTST